MIPLFRNTILSVAFAMLAACGGGGNSADVAPQTATVAIALTDEPTTDIDQALATITSIDLLGDDGQVNIFSGVETVDLLRLADYSELFAVQAGVPAGTYSKVRLHLSSLELIRLDDNGVVEESILPKLVANGKIDLNPQGPFRVEPGATMVITIDFDVGKSLKITETGSGKLIVRPVVFVDISTSLPSPGLTRLHGVVSDISQDGSFRLCQTLLVSALPDSSRFDAGNRERCVRVRSDDDTGIFGEDGLPSLYADLEEGEEATVIGRLQPVAWSDDGDDEGEHDGYRRFDLNAYLIEEGALGTYTRLRGIIDGPVEPGTGQFLVAVTPGQGFVFDGPQLVQLYPGSRVFTSDGVELAPEIIEAGTPAILDSVLAVSSTEPDILRTPLVILELDASADEQVLTGELVSVETVTGRLIVAGPLGDRCVEGSDADVFLVNDEGGSLVSERGTLADLMPGDDVNVFGIEGTLGCLVAGTILSGNSAP